MNRRTFIKVAATATAALALPACQQAPQTTATPSSPPQSAPTVSPTPVSSKLVTIPNTVTWNMVSAINQQEYRIFVALPDGYAGGARFPVIYLTDGNGNFSLARTLQRQLINDKYVQPALLVGVDYPFDSYDTYKDLRTRDLATEVSFDDRSAPGATGAPAFLRFLCEELKPVIDANYRTESEETTLIGHSFGGLFALYALFQESAPFYRYVIGSPSIWWDGGAILKKFAAYAKNQTDLPARVFMGVGGNEGDMVGDMAALAETLTAHHYPGLTLATQVFEGETHLSVVPFFISRGLRAVEG